MKGTSLRALYWDHRIGVYIGGPLSVETTASSQQSKSTIGKDSSTGGVREWTDMTIRPYKSIHSASGKLFPRRTIEMQD